MTVSEETYKHYLRDVVFELREMASDTKKTRDNVHADNVAERRFHEGVAWGILTSLSLLIEQAKSFDLSLEELGVASLDVDQELAKIGITKDGENAPQG